MTAAKEYSILKQQYDRLFEANKKLLKRVEDLEIELLNERNKKNGNERVS